MRLVLPRLFAFSLILLLLAGSAHAIGLAVKRGEKSISRRRLPLVCLGIETIGAALPLDRVILENLKTHKTISAVVSSSFDSAHPDLLTALAGGNRSLSLPILNLPPGRYLVVSLEFVGGAVRDGFSMIKFDLAPHHQFQFEVQPERVNYVGSIVIAGRWNDLSGPFKLRDPYPVRAQSETTEFASYSHIDDSVARDRKWSIDIVPGLAALPWAASPMSDMASPTGPQSAPAESTPAR